MEREYWTELDGTNGLYEISNFGNVRNVRQRRNLKLRLRTKNGNSVVVSLKNKKANLDAVKRSVGLEVYRHFAKEPLRFKKFKVYHKDGNIWNNHIDNLFALEHITNNATKEQQDKFESEAYKCVKNIVNTLYNIKGFDKENLVQESIMLIWKYLPNFKIGNNFFVFCKRYVNYAFQNLIKQFNEFYCFSKKQERIYN